uniref:glycerol kinase n=1 Tax=Odontella aurita TaxID=265563 RepID=A0A7S4MDM5_9STRA
MSSMVMANQCTVRVHPDVLREDTFVAGGGGGGGGVVSGTGSSSSPELIGSIHQGSTSTEFVVFTRRGRVAASARAQVHEITYLERESGSGSDDDDYGDDAAGRRRMRQWREYSPLDLYSSVRQCVESLSFELRASHSVDLTTSLKAVGIANQRGALVAWNGRTGECYYNAIAGDCCRTKDVAKDMAAREDADRLRERKGGLPIGGDDFAGMKVKWLLDNVPRLRADLDDPNERNYVRFGTVDAWLAYQLTGSPPSSGSSAGGSLAGGIGGNGAIAEGNTGGAFVTDVTNASRWLFMDLAATSQWDPALISDACRPHSVPLTALPRILPSSGYFGTISTNCGVPSLGGVTIACMMGDVQSGMFGNCAFDAGEAGCTYGEGLNLTVATGTERVQSKCGLVTTMAYQLGPKLDSAVANADDSPEVSGLEPEGSRDVADPALGSATGPVHYALEGTVPRSGGSLILRWLAENLQILSSSPLASALAPESSSSNLASSVPSNDGLYFVPPAFSDDCDGDGARGCIVGMSSKHTRAHLVRAALESVAYRCRELLECASEDLMSASAANRAAVTEFRVDGEMTSNPFLMQFTSDMLNVEVVSTTGAEGGAVAAAAGAAFAAGLAAGVWKDLDEIRGLRMEDARWTPGMTAEEREGCRKGWGRAVEQSLGRTEEEEEDDIDDAKEEIREEETTEVGGESEEEPDAGAQICEREAVKVEESEAPRKVATAETRSSLGDNPLLLGAVMASALALGYLLGSGGSRGGRR